MSKMILILIIACFVSLTAQEKKAYFNTNMTIDYIDLRLNDALKLFDDPRQDFSGARLFELDNGEFRLEISRSSMGQLTTEEKILTSKDVLELRSKVDDGIAKFQQSDLNKNFATQPDMFSRYASGTGKDFKNRILWSSTLGGLFYFGPVLSLALDMSGEATALTSVGLGALGYALPSLLIDERKITGGAYEFYINGFANGLILSPALYFTLVKPTVSSIVDDIDKFDFGFEGISAVLFSSPLAHSLIGYYVGQNHIKDQGHAALTSRGGFIGSISGYLVLIGTAESQLFSEPYQLGLTTLATTAMGYYGGYLYGKDKKITPADAYMMDLSWLVYGWAGLGSALIADANASIGSLSTFIGMMGGLVVGDRLINNVDFNNDHIFNTSLITLGATVSGILLSLAFENGSDFPIMATYLPALSYTLAAAYFRKSADSELSDSKASNIDMKIAPTMVPYFDLTGNYKMAPGLGLNLKF